MLYYESSKESEFSFAKPLAPTNTYGSDSGQTGEKSYKRWTNYEHSWFVINFELQLSRFFFHYAWNTHKYFNEFLNNFPLDLRFPTVL